MNLQRLNWNPRNHDALNRFLSGAQPGEIAVFDWDNTCIFGDSGEAVLRHQVLHLAFPFGPERLREIIPDRVNGIDRVLINGQALPLPMVKGRIVGAYENIFGRVAEEISASAPHRDFCAGLLALNRGLEETPGIGCEFAYPWAADFLQGFSPAEVCRLAGEAIENELSSAIRGLSISDSRGHWSYRWTAGIRSYPEMTALADALQRAGCRVVVSTASNPWIVETMMRRTGFTAERVIGMAPRRGYGGLQGSAPPVPAPNFGPGKVENLSRVLDAEPVLVAGDSDGDYEMATAFPATRLKLLVRRPRAEKMAALYQKALAGDPRYLLQDVEMTAGRFSAAATGPLTQSEPGNE
jgi:hypothetical protein